MQKLNTWKMLMEWLFIDYECLSEFICMYLLIYFEKAAIKSIIITINTVIRRKIVKINKIPNFLRQMVSIWNIFWLNYLMMIVLHGKSSMLLKSMSRQLHFVHNFFLDWIYCYFINSFPARRWVCIECKKYIESYCK